MRLEKAEKIKQLALEVHKTVARMSALEGAECRSKASAERAEERLMELERKLNEAMRQLHSMTY